MSGRYITTGPVHTRIGDVTVEMGPGHQFADDQMFEALVDLGAPVAQLAAGERLMSCPHCRKAFKAPAVETVPNAKGKQKAA